MFTKRFSRLVLVSLLAAGQILSSKSTSAGDINLGTSFTYQGYLYEAGEEASGDYDFNFTMWDDGLAGAQVGGVISPTNVSVVDGRFTVDLDFGFGVFNGAQRWLEIEVRPSGGGSFTLLDPRQLLTATPYAQALRLPYYATQLQNGASFAITNPHASGTAAIFQVTDAGNSFEGVLGLNAGSGAGVRGQSDGFGPGVAGLGFYGLRGETPTSSGYAVYGLNANGNYGYIGDDQYALFAHHDLNGNTVYAHNRDINTYGRLATPNYGVYGRSPVSDGVYGQTNSTSASVSGVYGLVNSTSPGSYSTGVFGQNNGTGGLGIGVRGRHNGSGWGVLGESPDGVGVYGSSAGGLAGYFAGDVIVTGTLSGTVSISKIDHPLDPENMYLHHSGIASSEMMNLYNGNVVTDINGEAWANANRPAVEVAKAAEERGKYLHPAAYSGADSNPDFMISAGTFRAACTAACALTRP